MNEKSVEELIEEIQTLEKQFADQQSVMNELKAEKDALKNEMTRRENLSAEGVKSRMVYQEFLTSRIHELFSSNQALEAKINKLTATKEKLLAENKKMVDENGKLVDTVAEYALEHDGLIKDNDYYRAFATGSLYTEVEAMITETFRKYGYQVSPHAITGDNTKENDRQFELYKAVKKAKKSDKKAEKRAKNGEVAYSEAGYKNLLSEMVEKYSEILNKYDIQIVDEFIKQHATEADKQDGEVTYEEMIETILDKEQSRGGFVGFIKSTPGKIVALATTVVVVGLLLAGAACYQGQKQAENDLEDRIENSTLNTEVEDNYTPNKDVADNYTPNEKVEQDYVAKDELDDEYISKDAFIAGDVVNLDVNNANFIQQFQQNESDLENICFADVRGVQACQYNKENGETVVLLNCLSRDGREQVVNLSFTMDMKNISQAVKDGNSVLDFQTILNAMNSAAKKDPFAVTMDTYEELGANNNQGSITGTTNSTNQADENVVVNVSFDTTKNSKSLIVVCKVMVVATDDQGKTTINVYTSDDNVFKATADEEKAKEVALERYLKELGIELEDDALALN